MLFYSAYVTLVWEIYSVRHNIYVLFYIIYVRIYQISDTIQWTTVVNPSSVDVYQIYPFKMN